jgi:serine/threonine-protein kinase HipA
MKLAKEIGFNVPEVYILDGPHPLFIIERYDRQLVSGSMKRIHQQDFCQALGILSESKYEADGGPSFKDDYNLMLSSVNAKRRLESIYSLIDWLCFNLLIGNNDSHSKNISLLMSNKSYSLAPFYDLISTAVYPSLDSNFSFKIGEEVSIEKMGNKAISLQEKTLGIKERTLIERMQLVYSKTVEVQDKIISDMNREFPTSKIQNRIKDLIAKRAKNFKRAGLKVE